MVFRNPANGYEERIESAWLWTLLFGCFYFAVKGVWTHAIAAFLLALMTYGLSWLVYPFFANRIMETHFLRKGWIKVNAPNVTVSQSAPARRGPGITPPQGFGGLQLFILTCFAAVIVLAVVAHYLGTR
jgi:hypothetical protein